MRKASVATLAAISLVMVSALAMGSASATPEGKVYVCKYVGTPGVDERLQTGQNPIEVSINAIPDYQGPGSYFADAHDRSYVLGEVPMYPEPTAADCPEGDAPLTHSPTITGEAFCVDPETSTYGVDYTIDTDGATGIVAGTEPVDDDSLTSADFPLAGGSVTYSYSDGPDQTATYGEIALPSGSCSPGEPPWEPGWEPSWEPGWEPDDGTEVLPAGGGTSQGGTAFTGAELVGPALIMGLLTVIGLGALGLSRRRILER